MLTTSPSDADRTRGPGRLAQPRWQNRRSMSWEPESTNERRGRRAGAIFAVAIAVTWFVLLAACCLLVRQVGELLDLTGSGAD